MVLGVAGFQQQEAASLPYTASRWRLGGATADAQQQLHSSAEQSAAGQLWASFESLHSLLQPNLWGSVVAAFSCLFWKCCCHAAGAANRDAGRLNMAFVFLNRYLDLTEAMEEADGSAIENADFVQTDIPFDFHLPEKHYLSEARREEVAGLQRQQRPVPVHQGASSCGSLWLLTGGGHCVGGWQLCCASDAEQAKQLSNTSCSS